MFARKVRRNNIKKQSPLCFIDNVEKTVSTTVFAKTREQARLMFNEYLVIMAIAYPEYEVKFTAILPEGILELSAESKGALAI